MTSPLATALLQAGAAGTPQQPFRATVMPTDVQKAYSDYNNAMMQAYAAQVGQQNAMWGGLAGLGSAGLMGSGGIKGLSGLLSSGAGAAGAGAADAGATAAGAELAASGVGDTLASLGPLAFLAI